MKTWYLSSLLILLSVCSAHVAQAQCTQPTIISFSISPNVIAGDQSQFAVGTVEACLPNGVVNLDLYVQPDFDNGPTFICTGGQLVSNGCNYYGVGSGGGGNVTVSFSTNGYNPSGTINNGSITVSASSPGTNTQSLSVSPIGSPYETPTQDPDEPCPTCGTAGSPVNVTNGNAGSPINVTNGDTWIPQQDYSVPGLGGGLTLTRTWNSLWANAIPPEESGIFGDSWRSNFEERIQVLSSTVRYWKGNGSSLFYTFNSLTQSYSLTAPADDQTTLASNSNGWVITQKDGTTRTFNSGGYLTTIVDRDGNTTSINVDASNQNRIDSVTDASNFTLTFNYANSSFPRLCTSISDSVGTVAGYTYLYDSTNRLTQVQYADGSQYNFQFNDPNSNTLISLVTDSMGKTIEAHTYDILRRGLTSQQANDSNGDPVNKVSVTYGSPNAWENQVCDSTGSNCVSVQVSNRAQRHFISLTSDGTSPNACNTCGFAGRSGATLDASGYQLSYTDGNGHTAAYTYDTQGNLTSKSLPDYYTDLWDTWYYTSNSFGELLTATDPLGTGPGDPNHTTTYGYNAKGDLTSITTPPPNSNTPASVTNFTPNAQGQVTIIKDPLGNQTSITYCTVNQANCPYGLIYYVQDAKGNKTTYSYDARGNRLSVTDATSKITQFQYDPVNRLKLITYPTSPATTFQIFYDWRGRRSYVIDQNSNKTSYGYDDADRLLTVTDAQSPTPGVTTYAYDSENDLTDIWDAKNNHTEFLYFAGKYLYRTVFPSTEYEGYGWDGNYNLEYTTDRNSNTINYAYDYQNHLYRKAYPDGNSVTYTYDPAARLTEVQDSTTGTYSFAYDNMNRLTSTTTNYSFLTSALTVQYGYDAASNRTSLVDPQNMVPTAYGYDTLNRLANITLNNAQSPTFVFGYDALSRRNSLTRPNGVDTSYGYDPVSRLTSVLHKLGTTTLDGATYTYDNAGNRKTRTDKRLGTTLTYGYDNIYQLQTAKQGTTTKESYTYDLVGNRLTSLGVSPYNYNTSNELTSTPSGSYSYDNNGNRKTDPAGAQYTWDYENRLTQVVLPGTGGTVNFKYDPFGRRAQKAFTQNSTTTTTNYLYDGVNILETLNQSGSVLARYTDSLNVDEPLSELISGTTSYYEQDGLGSVSSLSNSAGALANTYTYDSYGKLTASSGTLANPFQYTGREFDPETGLYYYRARYYDQSAGRFLSEDPIRFGGGLNFYAYTGNSPTNFADPEGLLKVCCRPVRIPGARQAGACHCFLQTGDGHTLGGYFEFPYLNPEIDKKDDTQPKDKADCKDVGGCDADAKAKKAFGGIPRDLNIYGPNGTSNTVAQQILNGAGIAYTLPSCAWAGGYPGHLPPLPPIHIPGLPPMPHYW